MDQRELPPLAFLPALEAAGRLGSFKAAALELHLTPSAISQQVRAVEQALGMELFERRGRTVVLRPQGERYLRDVRRALRELASAGQRLRQSSKRTLLRLNTVPFVAHEFLLPRLAKLRERFPNLELQLDTSMRLLDLQADEVDATIRIGGGPWPGVATRAFGAIEATVVCAPSLARKLKDVRDLAEHPILEVRILQGRGMVNGLAAHGIAVDPAQVQLFESYFDTVCAAEHGLGIAFGMFPLTTHWVTAGRLAVPFDLRVPLPGYIALVHRHDDDARFPFAALTDWLRAEYEALPPLPKGRIVAGVPASDGARAARPRPLAGAR